MPFTALPPHLRLHIWFPVQFPAHLPVGYLRWFTVASSVCSPHYLCRLLRLLPLYTRRLVCAIPQLRFRFRTVPHLLRLVAPHRAILPLRAFTGWFRYVYILLLFTVYRCYLTRVPTFPVGLHTPVTHVPLCVYAFRIVVGWVTHVLFGYARLHLPGYRLLLRCNTVWFSYPRSILHSGCCCYGSFAQFSSHIAGWFTLFWLPARFPHALVGFSCQPTCRLRLLAFGCRSVGCCWF